MHLGTDSLCAHTVPKPSVSKACNSGSCPQCPDVPACRNGACPPCRCVKQDNTGTYPEYYCGLSKGLVSSLPFAVGCDTRGHGYSECCLQQGLVCNDGCTGVAYWKRQSVGQCSKKCGGGTRREIFSCKGKLCRTSNPRSRHPTLDPNDCKEEGCSDHACETKDPTGNYPCNQQPCPTYYWQVSVWGKCSRGCASGRLLGRRHSS